MRWPNSSLSGEVILSKAPLNSRLLQADDDVSGGATNVGTLALSGTDVMDGITSLLDGTRTCRERRQQMRTQRGLWRPT